MINISSFLMGLGIGLCFGVIMLIYSPYIADKWKEKEQEMIERIVKILDKKR